MVLPLHSMLFRSLCFFASKSYTNLFSPTSISTNPRANSHNYQIISSNYGTLRFGFQKTSKSSRPSVSFHASNSTMEASDRPEVFRALEASLGSTFSSQPIIPNPHPLIIVISGPSGVGKDAVIKRLMEVRQNLHFVVTATTRDKRPGEIDGKDYYFVAKDEFLRMIEKNELLEYALVYGDYKGIPKQQIRDYMAKGHDIVLRVDIQGAATLRRVLDDCAVFVFLVAESEESLVKRLIGRKTETIEALMRRVDAAREELRHLKEFDYVVVNKDGELEESVRLLGSILDAEKAKVQQRRAVI